MPVKPLLRFLLVAFVVSACSSVKKDDPEKNVVAFLIRFEKSLKASDDEIMKSFRVSQSREGVLAVMRILQNKEPHFLCATTFEVAQIEFKGEEVRVQVPARFESNGLGEKISREATLEFWLKPMGETYVVTKLLGEEFYNSFQQVKDNKEWELREKRALDERLPTLAIAETLEMKFDSVIWYATYEKQKYFYVVEGTWENFHLDYSTRSQKNVNARMGLADSAGSIIIPMEYELIGTIAFDTSNMVEVKMDGRYGYFDLATKQRVIEPEYDMIVPYHASADVFALVKAGDQMGWIAKDFTVHPGFPSDEARDWFESFRYLSEDLKLAAGNQVFCEIPAEDQIGNGIVMPPSYLVRHGLFEEIVSGITTTAAPLHAWTEYTQTTGSLLERIADGINAVVTSMTTRYLEGREEFYHSNTIVFVDSKLDTLGLTRISGQEISMKMVDSSLLEISTLHDYWFMEYGVADESGLFSRSYFTITDDGSVRQQKTHRLFPETQFVKLDSSYITGTFKVYNPEIEDWNTRTILSVRTLTSMRDEILASYGYSFPGTEQSKEYDTEWYTPRYKTREEFLDELTDIDRHNISFLDRMIELLSKVNASA